MFGIGAALCAVAGALLGPLLAVQVGMGENILILAFVVIVIGGIGSIRGALDRRAARRLHRHARAQPAAARAPRVPAAAVGERGRAGVRVGRGVRVHGGRAGVEAARPVPGARLMAGSRGARRAPASPRAGRGDRGCCAAHRPAVGAGRARRRLLPQPGQPHRRLRHRRDQPEPRARLRRHGVVRPRRVRRPGRLRHRHPDQPRASSSAARICWPRVAVTALAALLIGAISLRTRGVYFIMITLAFAQMLFYLSQLGEGLRRRRGAEHPRALGDRRARPGGVGLDLKNAAVLLLRRAGRAGGIDAGAGALRAVALRPRGAGAARRRRARRGAGLSDLSLQAHRLRRRRRAAAASPAR